MHLNWKQADKTRYRDAIKEDRTGTTVGSEVSGPGEGGTRYIPGFRGASRPLIP